MAAAVVNNGDDSGTQGESEDGEGTNVTEMFGSSSETDEKEYPVLTDLVLSEQKQRLRLKSAKHDDLGDLTYWATTRHHRAIVCLLTCLAGAEIWETKKGSKAQREDRFWAAYKGWAALYKIAMPKCRVRNFLLKTKPTPAAKQIKKDSLVRKFITDIKGPLVRLAAIVRTHLDFSIGGIPRSGRTWEDVLEDVVEWWRCQQYCVKEIDKHCREVVV